VATPDTLTVIRARERLLAKLIRLDSVTRLHLQRSRELLQLLAGDRFPRRPLRPVPRDPSEVSPSGTGIKVIARIRLADLPAVRRLLDIREGEKEQARTRIFGPRVKPA
jgi:hypothetical protein